MFAGRVSRCAFSKYARSFGSASPKAASSSKESSVSVFSLLFADSSRQLNRYFHQTGVALAILVPLAFQHSSEAVSIAANLAMTPIIGFHALVGMNNVVTDYIPKQFRTGARFMVLGSSLLIVLGGVALIFQGHSFTGLVGDLWKRPKKAEE